MTDIAERIKQFVWARDAIKKLEDEFEQRSDLKELRSIKAHLEGILTSFLNEHNMESLKTEHGTCYVSTRWSASVADGEAFMEFVKTGNWDLIERRASSTAVRDFVQEHNELPAGVNLTAIQTIGVRRPATKKAKLLTDTNHDNEGE